MIEKLTVRNFRSLKFVEIPLKPFTVFVGPNNAGKSNILDALRFIQELAITGAGAIAKRGGMLDLLWNSDVSETLLIQIEGKGSKALGLSDTIRYLYEIEIAGAPDGSFRIVSERFSAKAHRPSSPSGGNFAVLREYEQFLLNTRVLLQAPASGGSSVFFDLEGKSVGGTSGGIGCHLGHVGRYPASHPVLGEFATGMLRWLFSNAAPSRMRGSSPVRKLMNAGPDGESLSTVIHAVRNESPEKFREIEESLRQAVPEFEELLTALAEQEGYTYIAARERDLSIRIKPWMLSDGTLRLLALLAALHPPLTPPLICLEEPESYVHPRLVELVAGVLRRASRESQVLVTTHSPYFLNSLDPEDVLVVQKKQGRTEVRGAGTRDGLKDALKTLGFGEIWYSGHIGGVPE